MKAQDTNVEEPLLGDESQNVRKTAGWLSFNSDDKQELAEQLKLGVPFVFAALLSFSKTLVTLGFVGHLGQDYLAAVGLALALWKITGRDLVLSLTGAQRTLQTQAYGADNIDAATALFRRTCWFLLVHAVPVATLWAFSDRLFEALGQEQQLAALAQAFSVRMIPGLACDVLTRPVLNSLSAQHKAAQQTVIAGISLAVHFGANAALAGSSAGDPAQRLHGAAWALCISSACSLVLAWTYMLTNRELRRVILGTPGASGGEAMPPLGQYARLAYWAILMRSTEGFALASLDVIAGLFTGAATQVAAISLSFQIYGWLFMGFVGPGASVGIRVGTFAGAGNARGARTAYRVAFICTMGLWLIIAFLLVEPHVQGAIIDIFVSDSTDSNASDLRTAMRYMLYVVVVMELLDALTMVLGGVISALGMQKFGARLNLVAFYALGMPLALVLGFPWGAGLKSVGLYAGMTVGMLVQTISYYRLVHRIDWGSEVDKAAKAFAAKKDAACA